MIRRISTEFVPVAVNLYKVRRAKDAGGDLFRSVQRQKDQYQGIWIVSPEGRVLAGHHDIKNHKTWSQEILETIDGGLRAFGSVSPRRAKRENPLPYRGRGVKPDGSVSVAVYVRSMLGGGSDSAPSVVDGKDHWKWAGALRPDGPPVIDSLALSPKEWSTLTPPRLEAGSEWAVPEAVARKFSRALSPSSDQSTMPRPEEAKVAELKAIVESVGKGQARIRLTGRWATEHTYNRKPSYGWASAEGIAVYDIEKKALERVLLVFSGAFKSVPPWDKGHRPIGAVMEWGSGPSD